MTVATVPFMVTVLPVILLLKLVPVMTTEEPTAALVGVNDVMVGDSTSSSTVKSSVEVAVTPFTVTEILPVVAFSGTTTVSCVSEAEVTVAPTPLNITVLFAAIALKFVPMIVTEVPSTPLVGVNPARVGLDKTASSLQEEMTGTIIEAVPNRFKNSVLFIGG